jgi:hypothetical protein
MGKTKKPSLPSQQNYCFADKRFEISNLSLIRDMVELVEVVEVFN